MTRNYSSNGVTISRSSSSGHICAKCDVTPPSDFEAEWTYMNGVSYSGEVAFGGARITHDINNHQTWYYYQECTVQDSTTVATVQETISSGDVIKVTRENHVLKLYRNGTLKHTITKSSDYPYFEIGAFSSSRSTTFKDIKIKPL